MNTYLRKIKKNSKALSPVVASIILIAVTVAVSVVVAAWMGGTTIGLMGNAEQATVTNLDFSTANHIIATVQNTGNAVVTLKGVYVNTADLTSDSDFTPATGELQKGDSATVDIDLGSALTVGNDYTVKITTAKGNNLVLTATMP